MQPTERRRTVPEPDHRGTTPASFVMRRRAGLGALALIVAAAVGAGWLRWRFGDTLSWGGENLLDPTRIQVRGVAPWVQADLKAEAMRAASLDHGLPLDDPELAKRIARAFETHPWVKQVVEVRLAHPPAAVVEIVCREPAAMVAVKGGLLAVDADSVVLPSADFTAESAAVYPRIGGVTSSPQGPEGSRWGDGVVEEGAAIATVIGPEWKSLGLVECRPVIEAGMRRWLLVGPGGRKILFGAAPGSERPDEPAAAVKLAALRKLVGQPLPEADVDLTRQE